MDAAAKLAFCYGLTTRMEAAKVGSQGIQFLSKLADKMIPDVIKDQANIVGQLTKNVSIGTHALPGLVLFDSSFACPVPVNRRHRT